MSLPASSRPSQGLCSPRWRHWRSNTPERTCASASKTSLRSLSPLALRLTFNDKLRVKMTGQSALQALAQVNPVSTSRLLCERLEGALGMASVDASRRAPALLTSMSLTLRPLLVVPRDREEETADLFPLLSELMHLSLPGLDSNDAYKTTATASCFATLFSWVPLHDDASDDGAGNGTDHGARARSNNTTMLKSRLCEDSVSILARLRASFEGFASLFVDRILVLVAAMDSLPASQPPTFERMRDRALNCAIDAFARSLSPDLLRATLGQILPSVLSCPSHLGDRDGGEHNLTEGGELFLTLLEALVRADPAVAMDFFVPRCLLRLEAVVGCDLDSGSTASSLDSNSFCWLLHVLGALATSASTAPPDGSINAGKGGASTPQDHEGLLVKHRRLFEGTLKCVRRLSDDAAKKTRATTDDGKTEKESSLRTVALSVYENLLASLLGTYPAKQAGHAGHSPNWGIRAAQGDFAIHWHTPLASETQFAESLVVEYFDSSLAKLASLVDSPPAPSAPPPSQGQEIDMAWKQGLDGLCSTLEGVMRAGVQLAPERMRNVVAFCETAHARLMLNGSHFFDVLIVKRFVDLLTLVALCMDGRETQIKSSIHLLHSVMWHRHGAFKDIFATRLAQLSLQQEADAGATPWRRLELIQPPWLAEKEALVLHSRRSTCAQRLRRRLRAYAASDRTNADNDSGHAADLTVLTKCLVDMSCHVFSSVRVVAQASVNTVLGAFPYLLEQILPELLSAAESPAPSGGGADFGRAIGLVSLLHQRLTITAAWRLGNGRDYAVRLVRALTTGPLLKSIERDDKRSELDTLSSSLLVALLRARGHAIPGNLSGGKSSVFMIDAHEEDLHWRVRLVLWAFELATAPPSDYLDQPVKAKSLMEICTGLRSHAVPVLPLRKIGTNGLVWLAGGTTAGETMVLHPAARIDSDSSAQIFFQNLTQNHPTTTAGGRSRWSAGVAELLGEIVPQMSAGECGGFECWAQHPHSSTAKLDNTIFKIENVALVRYIGLPDVAAAPFTLADVIRCLQDYSCGLSDDENLRARRCTGAECLCGVVLDCLQRDARTQKDTVSALWEDHLEQMFVRCVGEASPLGKAEWIHATRLLVRASFSTRASFCERLLSTIVQELSVHAKNHSAKQLHSWLSLLCAAVDELSTDADASTSTGLTKMASELLLITLTGPGFDIAEIASQHSISSCRQASAGCLFVFHRATLFLTADPTNNDARRLLERLQAIAARLSNLRESSLAELETGLKWCLLEQYREAGALHRSNHAALVPGSGPPRRDYRIVDTFFGMALSMQNDKEGGKKSELAQIAKRVVQLARGASVTLGGQYARDTFWQALQAAATSDATSTRCCVPHVAAAIYARCRHSLPRDTLMALEKVVLTGLADTKSVEVQEASGVALNVIVLSSDGLEAATRLMPIFEGLLKTKIPQAHPTIMPESFVEKNDAQLSREGCESLWKAKIAKRTRTRVRRLAKVREGQLGIGACVLAYPYTIPDWVPSALVLLATSQLRGASVMSTLSRFRQSHQDGWDRFHKWKFTTDQMDVLRDSFLPANYYA